MLTMLTVTPLNTDLLCSVSSLMSENPMNGFSSWFKNVLFIFYLFTWIHYLQLLLTSLLSCSTATEHQRCDTFSGWKRSVCAELWENVTLLLTQGKLKQFCYPIMVQVNLKKKKSRNPNKLPLKLEDWLTIDRSLWLTLLSLKSFSLTARLFQNRKTWSFSVRIFKASGAGRGTGTGGEDKTQHMEDVSGKVHVHVLKILFFG